LLSGRVITNLDQYFKRQGKAFYCAAVSLAVQRHVSCTAAVSACRVYGVTSNTEERLDYGPRYRCSKTAGTPLQQYCYGDLSLVGHNAVCVGEYL